jgi:hypothetical protein
VARDTGDATAGDGGVAVSGVINAPVMIGAAPVARSVYRQQIVSRIAPQELIDREAELEEMGRFCVGEVAGGYMWWRAEAWSGKTALMSTFVLRPPARLEIRIRVVSFFVISRWAGQSGRIAFTDAVIEQLAELLREPIPAFLTDTTRDRCFWDLLERAASACVQHDERLVLLVDGIDEDDGVPAGGPAHSIAALLPANPPPGLRVIVAGRPNPPIPGDVPDGHPLRDPASVRQLAPSPQAAVVRHVMEAELKALLLGTEIQKDLVGLVAAAGGGLSASDLAELTGETRWEINEYLSTVTGRSFATRPSKWQSNDNPEVYILGHDGLQDLTVERFGPLRLEAYRDRIHSWAEKYRTGGWPQASPEYLLRGYFDLLKDTKDLPRLVRCAVDMRRHDRVYDRSGGDAAAQTEIQVCFELLAEQTAPDLTAILRLAHHRDQLAHRNDHFPLDLPAVWARLGRVTRAESLATSITDPYQRAHALARVAGGLDQAGQHEEALRITSLVEEILSRIESRLSLADPFTQAKANSYERTRALVSVSRALGKAGLRRQASEVVARASQVARAISYSDERPRALATVAAAIRDLAQTKPEQPASAQSAAVRLAEVTSSPDQRARLLTKTAFAMAQAGQVDEAAKVVGEAEQIARSIVDPILRAQDMAEVAKVLAESGRKLQAAQVAAEAARTARSVANTNKRALLLIEIARGIAQSGQCEPAQQIARSIASPVHQQVRALAAAAGGLAQAGRAEQAVQIAVEAAQTARAISSQFWQVWALTDAAWGLLQANRTSQAKLVAIEAAAIAPLVTNPDQRARAVAKAAWGLAETEVTHRSGEIVRQIQEALDAIGNPAQQRRAASKSYYILSQCKPDPNAQIRLPQMQIYQAITDPREQALEGIKVVEHMMEEGRQTEATRAVASICSGGRFPDIARAVLMADPMTSTVVAELTLG